MKIRTGYVSNSSSSSFVVSAPLADRAAAEKILSAEFPASQNDADWLKDMGMTEIPGRPGMYESKNGTPYSAIPWQLYDLSDSADREFVRRLRGFYSPWLSTGCLVRGGMSRLDDETVFDEWREFCRDAGDVGPDDPPGRPYFSVLKSEPPAYALEDGQAFTYNEKGTYINIEMPEEFRRRLEEFRDRGLVSVADLLDSLDTGFLLRLEDGCLIPSGDAAKAVSKLTGQEVRPVDILYFNGHEG